MNIFPDKYCGDAEMIRLLEKAGARLSISSIYGLFYGCLAAPHMVAPSQYMPMIFGEEDTSHDSMEETQKIFGNLMSLWNFLAEWKPEKEPVAFPDIRYADTYEGITQRLKDDYSLVEYFIKGLDMGHAADTDFAKGGLESLKILSETGVIILKYAEVIEHDQKKDNDPGKDLDYVAQLEDVAAGCIASMNLSLKAARIREAEQMRMLTDSPSKSAKIPRNDPCPCGSGKKYKKCCGLVH